MADPILITFTNNDLLALMEVVTHYKMLYYWAIKNDASTLTDERKGRLEKIEAIIAKVLKM